MDLLDKLKGEGYEVTIREERATPEAVKYALDRRAKGERLAQPAVFPRQELRAAEDVTISPHGGRTLAIISLEGEEVARGEAVCAPTDNFERHVGRMKALGRAVGVLRAADYPRGA